MRLLVIFFILPIWVLSQNSIPPEFEAEVQHRINQEINHGISIATIDGNGNVVFSNYGLENTSSPVNENSTFEIASLSKTFTSSILTQLEKNEHLALKQEIRKFIPDTLPEYIKQITFYELINHTSGLPRLPLDFWPTNWDNPFLDHSEQKLLSSLMKVELDETKVWGYSNLGYALLGYIIDNLTTQRGLENYLTTLGLKNTFTSLDQRTSTVPNNFGHTVESWDFPTFNRYMGGIKSSTVDMAAYLKNQTKSNPVFSTPLHSQDIQISETDSLFSKMGWLVFVRNNEEIIWHNGISGGCNSFMGYNSTTQKAIVILSNSKNSITDLGLTYLSSKFPLNKAEIPLTTKIESQIHNQQIDLIPNSWNNSNTAPFYKDPLNLVWLQSHYISKNNLEIALLLNGLLLKDYPDDWEVVFHRAIIYELKGEYAASKEQYNLVNQLFPENNFVSDRLQKIQNLD